mgnify:CR=1 FL=1
MAFNKEHGIDPTPLRKKIADITDQIAREEEDTKELLAKRSAANDHTAPVKGKGKKAKNAEAEQDNATLAAAEKIRQDGLAAAPAEDLVQLIEQMNEQMRHAASELQFELAARLRDEVSDLKKELRQMQQAGHA